MTDKNKELVFLYTLIEQHYKIVDGKPYTAYCYISDGTISTPISKRQKTELISQALKHDRYQIAVEEFGEASATGFKPEQGKLMRTYFHHIFVTADEVFANWKDDKEIRFLTKPKKENQHEETIQD